MRKGVKMIDIDERYKKDWEFLKDNFSKEMEYYDKNKDKQESNCKRFK
mgnify:CR=1 FL=1